MPETRVDPYVCPRGHHSVEIGVTRIRCDACRKAGRTWKWDRDQLVDLREEDHA